MKKTVIFLILSAVVIICFTACSSQNGAGNATPDAADHTAANAEISENAADNTAVDRDDTESDESDENADNATTTAASVPDRDTLFQVSLLQGLTFGDYHGSITVGELKRKGDTGLGTFDALNGELIMLDGTVYRAAGDGTVEAVPDDETIPFADVTFFDTDDTQTIENIPDYDALRELLNQKVAEMGGNRFYIIHIDGDFGEMNVRSEYQQEEPYRTLAEALEYDQTFYDYENITGTVVGLYCPPYMDRLNATGWHLHFISEDRTQGGHVLGLSVVMAQLSFDITDGFQMLLPETDMFAGFDLTVDQSEDIEKVETNVSRDDA